MKRQKSYSILSKLENSFHKSKNLDSESWGDQGIDIKEYKNQKNYPPQLKSPIYRPNHPSLTNFTQRHILQAVKQPLKQYKSHIQNPKPQINFSKLSQNSYKNSQSFTQKFLIDIKKSLPLGTNNNLKQKQSTKLKNMPLKNAYQKNFSTQRSQFSMLSQSNMQTLSKLSTSRDSISRVPSTKNSVHHLQKSTQQSFLNEKKFPKIPAIYNGATIQNLYSTKSKNFNKDFQNSTYDQQLQKGAYSAKSTILIYKKQKQFVPFKKFGILNKNESQNASLNSSRNMSFIEEQLESPKKMVTFKKIENQKKLNIKKEKIIQQTYLKKQYSYINSKMNQIKKQFLSSLNTKGYTQTQRAVQERPFPSLKKMMQEDYFDNSYNHLLISLEEKKVK